MCRSSTFRHVSVPKSFLSSYPRFSTFRYTSVSCLVTVLRERRPHKNYAQHGETQRVRYCNHDTTRKASTNRTQGQQPNQGDGGTPHSTDQKHLNEQCDGLQRPCHAPRARRVRGCPPLSAKRRQLLQPCTTNCRWRDEQRLEGRGARAQGIQHESGWPTTNPCAGARRSATPPSQLAKRRRLAEPSRLDGQSVDGIGPYSGRGAAQRRRR